MRRTQSQPMPSALVMLKNALWYRPAKILMLIGLLCFISALAVVFVSNAYLENYVKNQKALQQSHKLQTTWTKLLIEQGTWAQYPRVEKIAASQLKMIYPQPKDLRILT